MPQDVTSDTLLEMADSFSDDWIRDLTEPPSDPVEADNPTDFTAAAWNKYTGEYEISDIRKLTSYVSENWSELGNEELESVLASLKTLKENLTILRWFWTTRIKVEDRVSFSLAKDILSDRDEVFLNYKWEEDGSAGGAEFDFERNEVDSSDAKDYIDHLKSLAVDEINYVEVPEGFSTCAL